jgi:hypothetical protein
MCERDAPLDAPRIDMSRMDPEDDIPWDLDLTWNYTLFDEEDHDEQ